MISTKGRYALRVMLDLAEQDPGEFIPLKDIAARQEISEKYLEGILPVLIRNHFLEGHRGKGGGYRLTRPPETYTVASILKLTERSLAPVSCLTCSKMECDRADTCRTLPIWKELYRRTEEYLESVRLSDLLNS